ncbi:MAG: hypothetical protein AB1700_10575 [Bacillota bacterium]
MIPSFFLVATLKLPGMRWTIPVVLPLFVFEDLLESTGYLASVMFFLCPSLARKVGARTGGMRIPYFEAEVAGRGRGNIRQGNARLLPSLLRGTADLVRTLRYCGRFTLVEIADGSSGTEITVRLV